MSTEKVYTMTTTGLSSTINNALDHFISRVRAEGEIDEHLENALRKYRVILAQYGFFGNHYNKIFLKQEEGYVQMFVIKPTDRLMQSAEE